MERFNLTNALNKISERYTPDQRAEDAEANALRRESLKQSLDPNSMDQRIARAVQHQADILRQIEFLNRQPPSTLLDDRMTNANNRLAELLTEQGQYADAITITQDTDQREWYRKVQDAIDEDDTHVCECSDDRVVDRSKNVEITIPARSEVLQIVSEKHGGVVNLQRCSKCGFLNAR